MSETIDPSEAIRELLLADSAVRSLVGDRIRPQNLDQADALPAIEYSLLSTNRLRNLDGTAELRESRVQLDNVAKKSRSAAELAAAVLAVLDSDDAGGYRGDAGGLFFCDVAIENVFDASDPPPPGSASPRRRRTFDAVIVWKVA